MGQPGSVPGAAPAAAPAPAPPSEPLQAVSLDEVLVDVFLLELRKLNVLHSVDQRLLVIFGRLVRFL